MDGMEGGREGHTDRQIRTDIHARLHIHIPCTETHMISHVRLGSDSAKVWKGAVCSQPSPGPSCRCIWITGI